MNVERLKQYISKATFAHGADRDAVMQIPDELSKPVTIGNQTSERVFKASGLTNLSDLQAVFDAVESALIAQASAAPEQEPVAWMLSVEGYKDVLVDNYQRALSEQEHFLGRGRNVVIRALYPHADPSEVAQLRAERDSLKRTTESLWQAHDAATQRAQLLAGGPQPIETPYLMYCLGKWWTCEERQKGAAIDRNYALIELAAQHPVSGEQKAAQMSREAASTIRGMVEFCLNRRYCMGMDEGFKSFDPEVEHDFVKELRAFAESNDAPPAAQDVSGLVQALEELLAGTGSSPGANKRYGKARAALATHRAKAQGGDV